MCFHTYICIYIFVTGTLGYVMSEVEDERPFSEVVKAAKRLGYTEPGLLNFSFAVNHILEL